MKLNKYLVEICIEKGIIECTTHFTLEEVTILKENENRMVLDDEYFTTLRKKKVSWDIYIGEPSIQIYNKDPCWGTKIKYLLYTYKTKRPETIKKEIRAKVQEKFGAFMGNIDLSFIK